jgi:hypothetical protein
MSNITYVRAAIAFPMASGSGRSIFTRPADVHILKCVGTLPLSDIDQFASTSFPVPGYLLHH